MHENVRMVTGLAEAGFDEWVGQRSAQYYEQDEPRGRRSIPLGVFGRQYSLGVRVRTRGGPEKRLDRACRGGSKAASHRHAVLANRRRVKPAKGKALQRRRGEVFKRSFAHICDSGGARRMHVRGLTNVNKRYVLAAAIHNLARIMRRLFGVGKPKAYRIKDGLAARVRALWADFWTPQIDLSTPVIPHPGFFAP